MLGIGGLLEKRVAEFHLRLSSMNHRAHDIVQGSCFMCFKYRGDNQDERFIQFSFEKENFHLDMPCQTLSKIDAEKLIAEHKGFFYLSKAPEFMLHNEDVAGFDPFRAVYFYGDERSAAKDMAHIFFDLWKLPIDAQIYVTAASFSGKHEWENNIYLTV